MKNIGGRGYHDKPPVCNHRLPFLQLRQRPSYAPRNASIPCGLIRLRILPVATGVYPNEHSPLLRARFLRSAFFQEGAFF